MAGILAMSNWPITWGNWRRETVNILATDKGQSTCYSKGLEENETRMHKMLSFPMAPVAGRTSIGYHFEFSLLPGFIYTNAQIEGFTPAGKLANTGGLLITLPEGPKPVAPGSYANPGSYFND